MISYAKGEITSFEANIVVNTVNCVGVMGKGVALAIRNRYPQIQSAYRRACRTGMVMPGTLWCWHAPDGTLIWSAATKNHWRDPSQYRWVESCLSNIAILLAQMTPHSIVVPPLGCGNGGLEWERVRPMITNALGEFDSHNIIVLEPQA